MNAKREPVAFPSPDRSQPVEIHPGMRVVRRPIYQGEAGAPNAMAEMVTRMAVAKTLGFTAFEIDATPVAVIRAQQKGEVTIRFDAASIFGYRQVVEGEEWKEEKETAKAKSLAGSHVITVYALVVE